MSDDLDDLKAAMQAATPAPDAARRAQNLALAQKNFETLQGSPLGARPNSDRPKTGLFRGVRHMMNTLSNRGALTATTALAAVGLVLVLPQLMDQDMSLPKTPTPASHAPAGGPKGEAESLLPPASPPGLSDQLAKQDTNTAAPVPLAPLAEELARSRSSAEPLVGAVANPAPAIASQGYAAHENSIARAPSQMPLADWTAPPAPDTEAYPDAPQNPLKITSENPVSTFSIDVDTASYAVVRSSLMNGQLPPEGAVRVEEMVNYFPYQYPAPSAGEAPFRPTVTVTGTPWNTGTQLVHIAIQGQKPLTDTRPPLNLVFLIDTSGSMNQADKLPLLKQSLSLMLSKLGASDSVAIVTYAGSAGQVLAPTPATNRAAIMAALDNLSAGGSTAGQAGLQQAYAVADTMKKDGDVTRVILATDGDFNVGLSDPAALKTYIATKRDSGTYLSVLGFGRGNLDDATMQALAQNGNGQAAYIDTLSEAQKVLVDQFSGALFPIADDVKIQVEFNPATVAEYRLIGYETRALAREDFNNDKVDAGDIGAGISVTALYEITPTGSPAQLSDPLRYQPAEAGSANGELGFLKLRYKTPGASASQLVEAPIVAGGEATDDMRFAIAIAGFGQLLGDSKYLGDWGYTQAIDLATSARGADPFGYRAEAVQLMRLAKSLTGK